jgi:hypoxanthine phosphoribosyltransferase
MLTATTGSIRVHNKEFVVHIDSTEIQQRVAELGRQINVDYQGKTPVIIGVLNGAFIFMADLLKQITTACETTFIKVSSYDGMVSTGKIKQIIGITHELKDRHVILVEDIVDSGNTVNRLTDELKKHHPASIKLATLIFKPTALKHDVAPDYVGFETGPEFLVGYGMDYDGLGRNLQDIYKIKHQ